MGLRFGEVNDSNIGPSNGEEEGAWNRIWDHIGMQRVFNVDATIIFQKKTVS